MCISCDLHAAKTDGHADERQAVSVSSRERSGRRRTCSVIFFLISFVLRQRKRKSRLFEAISYPDAVGKDLEDALHREHARKAPIEVLKRFRVEFALLVKLLKHIRHVDRLCRKEIYSYGY